MRAFLKWLVAMALLYVLLLAGLFVAMSQPPERFGRIMSKVPDVAFIVFPFKPMWLRARAGRLQVGDPAPDFSLETADKKDRVQLSSFRGREPVVLVFGSYT